VFYDIFTKLGHLTDVELLEVFLYDEWLLIKKDGGLEEVCAL